MHKDTKVCNDAQEPAADDRHSCRNRIRVMMERRRERPAPG
jgi:hypothetical protein